MYKYLITILSLMAVSLVVTPVAMAADAPTPTGTSNAATICAPLYNGGQICPQVDNLLIDKKIQNPSTKEFVDNLSSMDPTYQAGQPIFFTITVSNKSDKAISNITVKDLFPQYVEFVPDQGEYDKSKKILTLKIDSLAAGASKTYNISGLTSPLNQLPEDQQGMCMGNQAQATFNSKTAQDQAYFCILRQEYQGSSSTQFPSGTTPGIGTGQPSTKGNVTPTPMQTQQGFPATTKGGTPVYQPGQLAYTPATGPEALPLLALIPTGIAGIFLRRKSR